MAFAQTNKATQAASAANPVTMAFDCNGGNLLVVGLTVLDNPRAGGAPTYNGVAMTDSGQGIVDSGDESVTELWYLVSPAAGSNTLSIPNTGTESIVPIASAWSGADVADVFDTSVSAFNAASADPTVAITTAATNELIIDSLASGRATPPVETHTLVLNQDNGAWCSCAQYTLADGTGGLNMDYTAVSDDWAIIAAAFKPYIAPVTRRIFNIS